MESPTLKKIELQPIDIDEFEELIANCTCESRKDTIRYYDEMLYDAGIKRPIAKAIIDTSWRHQHQLFKVIN